jgi:hypothetical protein
MQFLRTERRIVMARAMELRGSPTGVVAVPRSPLYQAYQILHFGFCALPVVAGLDKFANLLTRWSDYLAPQVATFVQTNTPFTPEQLMMAIGVVEIIAGLVVAIRPRVGGIIVGLWLGAVIANLILGMHYFDVALRDFGLMLGAFSLARLASHFQHAHKQENVVVHEDRGIIASRHDEHGRFWRHRADDMV